MMRLRHIRQRLRPEEALALLCVLPFVWMVVRHSATVHLNQATAVAYLAPAVVIGIALCLAKRTPHKVWPVVRDFLPFAIAVSVYENLHDVTAILHWPDRHEWLIAADEWLCGGINPVVWMQHWSNPRLTDALTLAYSTYYFYVPLLALMLYWRGQRVEFRDFMLAVVLTFYIGFIGYVAVPALDPWITLRDRLTVSLEGSHLANRALDLYTISRLKLPRDCFPSLHLAVSLVTLLFSWRMWRAAFWVGLPCVAALAVSTIYLRVHYLVDLIAAVPLALFSHWAAPRLNRWWSREL